MLYIPICVDTDALRLCNLLPDRQLQARYTLHKDGGYSESLTWPCLCAAELCNTSCWQVMVALLELSQLSPGAVGAKVGALSEQFAVMMASTGKEFPIIRPGVLCCCRERQEGSHSRHLRFR